MYQPNSHRPLHAENDAQTFTMNFEPLLRGSIPYQLNSIDNGFQQNPTAFAPKSNAMSFQDLAKQPSTIAPSFQMASSSTIASTLQEYGPPQSSHPLTPMGPAPMGTVPRPVPYHAQYQQPIRSQMQPPTQAHVQPPRSQHISMQPQMQTSAVQSRPSRTPMGPALTSGPRHGFAPNSNSTWSSYNISALIKPSSETAVTSSLNQFQQTSNRSPVRQPSINSNSTTNAQQNQISVIENNPRPYSPPLDQVEPHVNTSNLTSVVTIDDEVTPTETGEKPQARSEASDGVQPMTSTGRIPKKLVTPEIDLYDGYDLNSLVAKYRDLEREQRDNKQQRDKYEREINDYMRTCQGRNIDLDAKFRDLKADQRARTDKGDTLRTEMRKVKDLLFQKFSYKVDDSTPYKTGPKIARRAKMSTAAPARTLDIKDSHELELDLEDVRPWCRTCDQHPESIEDFCIHLHSKEHFLNQSKMSSPWRTHKKRVDKKKTYEVFKSICDKVEHRNPEIEHLMILLDKTLNPKFSDKQAREARLSRDRGIFQRSDQLMAIKGYDYLVPIKGYYCKLCNRTLCDSKEVYTHLKGFTHNSKFVENVALNPRCEIQFREELAKSNNKTARDEQEREKRSGAFRNEFEEYMPKASTSRGAYNDTTSESRKEVTSSSPKKAPATADIVPLGERFQPSALKKLRTQHLKARKTTAQTAVPEKNKEREEPEDQAEVRKRSEPKIQEPPRAQKSRRKVIASSDEEDEAPSRPTIERREVTTSSHAAKDPPQQFTSSQEITEIHLEPGDPENPFPDLDLCITGNAHLDSLKDPRLAQKVMVKIEKINLDDYKHMMADESTMWDRIARLTAKKEIGDKDEALTELQPPLLSTSTHFDSSGRQIPVVVDDDDDKSGSNKNEDSHKTETGTKMRKRASTRENVRSTSNEVSGDGKASENDNGESISTPIISLDGEEDDKKESTLSSPTGEDGDKRGLDMSFLENFFCER